MDQNAFRSLLSEPRKNGSPHTPTGRGSILPSKTNNQKKPAEGSKPAFKPRKLKKQTDSGYRDRATERRTGAAGDFAEAETILENFEKQHADDEDKEAVDDQRRYLGGDAEHTVLVKGLDFALLEQTRARLAASTSVQDDEELEEAFRGAISGSISPPVDSQPAATTSSSAKKRTREDLLRELKNKRAKSDAPVPPEDKALEEAKKEGKFKPIGFRPVGNSKPRDKDGKEVKKKKKKKVAESEANGGPSRTPGVAAASSTEADAKRKEERVPEAASTADEKLPVPEPIPQPENEDFDIFADAGEYEGINFGNDDDNGSDSDSSKEENQAPETPNVTKAIQGGGEPSESHSNRKWIEDDEPPSSPPSRPLPSRTDSKGKAKESAASLERGTPANGDLAPTESASGQEEEAEAERITRLAPLASSAVPSIRDILEADQALELERKRKERKEKKKKGHDDSGGGGEKKVSKEAKLNRQYQKFKSYTEKKGSGS